MTSFMNVSKHFFSTQLKERQLLVHEFCLLCLSNAAATFTNVTEFKALNASCLLFSSAMQLLTVVLDSCLHPNWHLINRGTAKNARDVLDEIACELFKVTEDGRVDSAFASRSKGPE